MNRHTALGILVIAVAVAGLALWLTRPGLASEVKRQGGEVVVEADTPEGRTTSVVFVGRPVDDADLVCLRGRKGFQRLFLDSTRVSGECLKYLEGASDLRWLSLGNCRITDNGLKHLPALPELELLNLGQTRVTDAGLIHLKQLKGLRQLMLTRTAITDAGLEHLKGLDQLAELDGRDTRITEAGIRRLREALPGLTRVQIGKDED
jgi:hypothetical protein